MKYQHGHAKAIDSGIQEIYTKLAVLTSLSTKISNIALFFKRFEKKELEKTIFLSDLIKLVSKFRSSISI